MGEKKCWSCKHNNNGWIDIDNDSNYGVFDCEIYGDQYEFNGDLNVSCDDYSAEVKYNE